MPALRGPPPRFTSFTATVLGENQRALRLLRCTFSGLRASITYGRYALELPFSSPPAMRESVAAENRAHPCSTPA